MNKRLPYFNDILYVVIIISLSVFVIFIGYKLVPSEYKTYPFGILALFLGLLFESLRISDSWVRVGYIFIAAFICSIIMLLSPFYNIRQNLPFFPYIFWIVFSFISAIFHDEKATLKLTEGVTLLYSISIIYWVINYGFMRIENWLVKSLLILGLLLSLFSIFNALTPFILSRTTRLVLSLWSSIIVLLMSIDVIYRVYQNHNITSNQSLEDGAYFVLQYFFLGVSSIYIVQNALMLLFFLPSRGSFFNSRYFSELQEFKNNHIMRYSDHQTDFKHACVIIVLTVGLYWLNYRFDFLPRYIIIWIVFMLSPLVTKLTSR